MRSCWVFFIVNVEHDRAQRVRLDRPGQRQRAQRRRYRAAGLGEINWRKLVDVLYEGGYDGVLSVEHEDPIWNATPERVRAGIELTYQAVRPLIVAEG